MLEVRAARMEDKARFRELWQICFGDTEAFMNWFFSERYFPELSSCLLEDGVIMSALQSYPLHIRLRGAILPASMLAGVSTHPERNGRGYMKQIFLHYMQRVRSQGIPVAIHTPAHLPTFFSRGHFPATNTTHLLAQTAAGSIMPKELAPHSVSEELALLQVCYQRATARYSGCVSRTMADFAYKFRDYSADGARCLVRQEQGNVLGYCVYYDGAERVHAEECFATDDGTMKMLLQALAHQANGKELHVKLPPDTAVALPEARTETRPQGVMGVADVSALLKAILRDSTFVFDVKDENVPQNEGIWNGAGQAASRAPHVCIPAGRLGQFLCGYRTLQDIVAAGEAQALDSGAVSALDQLFPQQTCFITDEY